MGTTPRGIYYPDPDSPIDDLRAQLQLLAETADTALDETDTDWEPLVMVNDFTGYGAEYRRVGPMVALRGYVSGIEGSAGLPCAFLPSELWTRTTWVSEVSYYGGDGGFATIEVVPIGLPSAGAIRCGDADGGPGPFPISYRLDHTYLLD